jgi:hypothetical protein
MPAQALPQRLHCLPRQAQRRPLRLLLLLVVLLLLPRLC